MKKFLFIPVAFALVAPLAICTNNQSATASALVPTATDSSAPTPLSTSKTTVAALTKDWYQYRATNGSYSAFFPGQPSESIQPDSSVQVIYEDQANNRVYLTQNVKLRANPNQLDAEEALDAAVASISQHGGTVIALEKISLNGLKGRQFTAQSSNGMVMKIRTLIDNKVPALYIAIVAAEKDDLDSPETQAFLDSVSIAQK
jgi:hypothetical protein